MTMVDEPMNDPVLRHLDSNGEPDPINIENFKFDETVKLINDAGIGLKCTIMTRTKAMLIYHHFKACVLETEYEPHTIAAACINLSVKYNEERIELETIIFMLYRMIDDGRKLSTLKDHFKSTLQAVKKVEIVILRMLEFDLNHTIAHQYLPYFMQDLQEEISSVWDFFAETCMRLASDFYLSNKCMIYKADELAIAVIQVSLYMVGIDNTYFEARLKVINDCPSDKIQSIIEDIFHISYMGPRAEKSRRIEKSSGYEFHTQNVPTSFNFGGTSLS